jgi:hypothetical protein
MIGMNSIGFLILLIIGVAVSAILHYHFKYYVTPGHWSFCSKLVVGWIGAWLGSQSLGIGLIEYPASTTEMFGTSRQSWARWR